MRVLGVDVARNVRRAHPGAEDTFAPAPPMIPGPPPLPTRVRESAFPRTGPQWAVGIGAILTTLGTTIGGVLYAFGEYRKTDAATRVESARQFDARLDTIEHYMATMVEDQVKRDAVNIAMACALNGGAPPARGVTCAPNACEPKAYTPDGKIVAGQPLCTARAEWPATRLLPRLGP